MPEQRKYYVVCEDKCLFEGMTKEQILTAIQQAVEGHEIHDIDTGFITKILEQNGYRGVKLWIGTEAEFNAIETKAEDTLYIYTTDFEEEITNEITKIKDGTTVVENANNAAHATNASNADNSVKVNNLEIIRNENGVVCINENRQVSVTIGGNDKELTWEMYAPAHSFIIGSTIEYKGETAIVERYNTAFDEPFYEIFVESDSGEFARATGQTIVVTYLEPTIIPQRKLLWRGDSRITSSPTQIDIGKILPDNSHLEFEFTCDHVSGETIYSRYSYIVKTNIGEKYDNQYEFRALFQSANTDTPSLECLRFHIDNNSTVITIRSSEIITLTKIYEVVE